MRVFYFLLLPFGTMNSVQKARNVVTRLVGEDRKVLFVPLHLIDLTETGLASFINTLMRSFMYGPQRRAPSGVKPKGTIGLQDR